MKGGPSPVSPWFTEHLSAVREAASCGPIVDLACGRGRHALAVAEMGLPIVGIDRNADFLAELGARATREELRLSRVRADFEADEALPLAPASCGAILVFRYLYRPLCESIERALLPGGLLLYETFTRDQLALGTGPSNPSFLLARGELPTLFPSLEVLGYREGLHHEGSEPAFAIAQLAARARRA